MTKKVKSLDDLVTGIKQLLLENRCSFSDEDKALLNECIIALQQAKEDNEKDDNKGGNDALLVIKVVELFGKLFTAGDSLKDFF